PVRPSGQGAGQLKPILRGPGTHGDGAPPVASGGGCPAKLLGERARIRQRGFARRHQRQSLVEGKQGFFLTIQPPHRQPPPGPAATAGWKASKASSLRSSQRSASPLASQAATSSGC